MTYNTSSLQDLEPEREKLHLGLSISTIGWAGGKCCTEAYTLPGELWLILLTGAQVSRNTLWSAQGRESVRVCTPGWSERNHLDNL